MSAGRFPLLAAQLPGVPKFNRTRIPKQKKAAAYRATHKKEIGAYNKAYRASHKEEIRAYNKAYRLTHKKEMSVYRLAHKKEIQIYSATRKNEKRAYYASHRKERVACAKNYRANHPQETRTIRKAYRLKRNTHDLKVRVGLSLDEFDALLIEQGGVCAICKKSNWKKTRPHVDHDHATGKIRGILCPSCNRALGHVHDNPEILRAMINYLKDSA